MQCRSRDTEAQSHEWGRASWGPRGMAQCVWLLTFEQPSDLPPVYMRFGRAENRMRGSPWTLKVFKYFVDEPFFTLRNPWNRLHHAFEPLTVKNLHGHGPAPAPLRRC